MMKKFGRKLKAIVKTSASSATSGQQQQQQQQPHPVEDRMSVSDNSQHTPLPPDSVMDTQGSGDAGDGDMSSPLPASSNSKKRVPIVNNPEGGWAANLAYRAVGPQGGRSRGC